MVLFKKKLKVGEHELLKEGNEDVMHINYENHPRIPSIEEDPICMGAIIEKLSFEPSVTRIIFHQRKKYEYGYNQTQLLKEAAQIYGYFIKQKKILSEAALEAYGSSQETRQRVKNLNYIVLNLLKYDPLGAYVEVKRLLREEKINREGAPQEYLYTSELYFKNLLEIYSMLNKTKLVNHTKKDLDGYDVGTREIYKTLFHPVISPDFMFTRLMASPPIDGLELDTYAVGSKTNVMIFQTKNTIKPLYHMIPPEFRISEEKYELLDMARKVLSEHEPKTEEFIDPEKMRITFFNIGRDLLTELADSKGLDIPLKEIEEMSAILVRYTVGFGLIESLLQDQNIQDISINGPIGQMPIYIVHGKYDECVTNIIPSHEDGESWASKFRLLSARPLDEANPILDTELKIPGARARVSIISKPLSPWGLAYSIRRHRDKPWTLALFIKNKMISDLAAGLISFLVDGSRTMLVAGTRGSGKTSLLGSVLVEIMRKHRIITVEDTLELPTESLRDLGHNIQPMKVRSALATTGSEISAEEGIRASLRLGDSALIVGEIRSKEALALYEAMRVGALANVVAGTIHGDSPYGVYDRVVHDLNVPSTSFKATDIIIVANPIKSADGLHKYRRVTQITEVRKEWNEDPLREGGFVDLMKYDSKTDCLQPTDALINGDTEIIKAIGGQIKEWAGSWDAIWDNIELRAKIKRTQVNYSESLNLPELLEARDTIHMNDEFHRISEKVKEEIGYQDPKMIFFQWEESLKKHIKRTYG